MLYVQIIEKKNPDVCYVQMEARSQRDAEQLQRGASINLDHKHFKVIITETPAPRNGTEPNQVPNSSEGRT
jgi:hypothetical protein